MMLWCKIAKLLLFLLIHTSRTKANEFFQNKEGDCGCTFQGDPVVTTLDGIVYVVPTKQNDNSRYTLTRDNNFQLFPCLFNVEMKISPLKNTDAFSSRVKSVEGHLGFKGVFKMTSTVPGEVILQIGFGNDQRSVTVPNDGSPIYEVANPSDPKKDHLVFRLWQNDLNFVWLKSLNCTSFSVFYNGHNEGGVVLDKTQHGMNVQGLCGNCDGNKRNDFKKSDGLLASNTVEFVESWLKI